MKETQRKSLIDLCIVLTFILTLTIGWSIYDNTVDRSGWVEKDGLIAYRDFHGEKVTGWQQIDGYTYYFDKNCLMVTGWQDWDGDQYYFGDDGIMYTGWKSMGDKRRYFGTDGVMHTGWLDLNDKRYYLDAQGAMLSGWQQIDGSTYYFGENGAMLSGWNTLEEKRYYFTQTGVLVTGRVMLDSKYYYFLDDGALFTGWEDTDQGRRYYAPEGAQVFGWADIDGKLYYFGNNGLTRSGWYQDGEYRYYLREDGSAVTGPQTIDDQLYYFTPKGIQVVLVNADNPVPEYYDAEMVNYIPWHDVAEIALEPLTRMLEDCKAAGYPYEFNSAYRSLQVQEDILWARTQEHIARGYTAPRAYAEARKTVALPGTSEHHLGLAVDVLNVDNAEKKALHWLGEHCWEYGFILRYAEEKAHVTGIVHEPWHFRYVGTRVSMDMKDSGLCLEEYLGASPVQDSTIETE